MTTQATKSVASEVRKLARAHNVTAQRDNVSYMATSITSLSGDTVILDTVEQLLVNLKRKGVMSISEILMMQVRYLQEKTTAQQKTKKTKKKLQA